MSKMMKSIIVILVVFMLSFPVYAKKASGQFTMMDKDGDGKVTFTELRSVHPDMDRDLFDKADINKDGTISHDEWYQFEDKPKMGRNSCDECGKGNATGKGKGKGAGKTN